MERTRTRTVPEQLLADYKWQYGTLRTASLKKDMLNVESMTDTITPGYYKLLKTGAILPMNAASKTSFKVVTRIPSVWGADIRYQGKPYGYLRYSGLSAMGKWGTKPPSFSPPNFPSLSEHDVSVMYTEALARAKTQGMDVLTFYAEYAKTVEMVTGLANRVVQRAHDIMKVKKLHTIKDRKAFISAFSDSWLEYRYGWRILAYDFEDIQEMIDKLEKGISLRFKAKGKLLRENVVMQQSGTATSLSFETVGGGSFGGTGRNFRHDWKIDEYHAVRSHAGVMIESVMRSLVTIDPLVTAYELVPYSFVVDWFFNVNNVLQAISPLLDERILQAYKRVDFVRTKRYEIGPSPQITYGSEVWTPYGTPTSITIEDVAWTRSSLTETEQQLTFGYVNNFSKLKLADTFALLWGRVRTLRKFTSI